jgi:hypothetical protein
MQAVRCCELDLLGAQRHTRLSTVGVAGRDGRLAHLPRMLSARKRLASSWDKIVTMRSNAQPSRLVRLLPACDSLVAMTMTARLLTVAGGRSLDVFVAGAEGMPLVVNIPRYS